MTNVDTLWIPIGSIAVALAAFVMLGEGGLIRRQWRSHVDRIDSYYDFLLLDADPRRLAALHIALLIAMLLSALALPSLMIALLIPVVAVAPILGLQRKKEKKIIAVIQLLPAWLAVVANSLRAAPSIGDALRSSVALTPDPLAGEIDLLVKEVALGEPLDQALRVAAGRINEPTFSSVMTSLIVARQSGGELPKVLSKTAETLREIERLEGVVRTKTAEGKSQSYVLAILPFVMCALLHKMDPNWIPQLTEKFIGGVILAICGVLWLGAIFTARKILDVDV